MMALTHNKNKPNVNTVIGRVKNKKTGFTKILSKPKTIATIIAVNNPSTCIPLRILDNKTTKTAVINTFVKISFILFFFTNLLKEKQSFNLKNALLFLQTFLDFRHEANALHLE